VFRRGGGVSTAPDIVADAIEVEEGGEQSLNLIREVWSLLYENSVYTPVVQRGGSLWVGAVDDAGPAEELEAGLVEWVEGRPAEWVDAGLEAELGEERVWSALRIEDVIRIDGGQQGLEDGRGEEVVLMLVGEGS
jgi:hypothetical protein